MVTPIICPHCNKDTGYTQEQFMYYVMTHDILCPHCGKVVIKCNNVMWQHKPNTIGSGPIPYLTFKP